MPGEENEPSSTSLVPAGREARPQEKPFLQGHVALINIDGVNDKNKVQFQNEVSKLKARGMGVVYVSRAKPAQAGASTAPAETKTETAPPASADQLQLVPSVADGAVVNRSDLLGVQYQVLPDDESLSEKYRPGTPIKPHHILGDLLEKNTWGIHFELTGIFIDTKSNSSGSLKSNIVFFSVRKKNNKWNAVGSVPTSFENPKISFAQAKMLFLKKKDQLSVEAAHYFSTAYPNIIDAMTHIDAETHRVVKHVESVLIPDEKPEPISEKDPQPRGKPKFKPIGETQFSKQIKTLSSTRSALPQEPSFWQRHKYGCVLALTIFVMMIVGGVVGGLLVYYGVISIPLWAGILIGVGIGFLLGLIIGDPLASRCARSVPKVEEPADKADHTSENSVDPTYGPRYASANELLAIQDAASTASNAATEATAADLASGTTSRPDSVEEPEDASHASALA